MTEKAKETGVCFCFTQDDPLQSWEELSQKTTAAAKQAAAARARPVCL